MKNQEPEGENAKRKHYQDAAEKCQTAKEEQGRAGKTHRAKTRNKDASRHRRPQEQGYGGKGLHFDVDRRGSGLLPQGRVRRRGSKIMRRRSDVRSLRAWRHVWQRSRNLQASRPMSRLGHSPA